MTSREVEELLGAPRFRVDYVFNGEPALREIYGTRDGRFTGFNFVDDVVIELEDLGWIDEAIFQGRWRNQPRPRLTTSSDVRAGEAAMTASA